MSPIPYDMRQSPMVMGGILVVGSTAIGFGVYKVGQAAWEWVADSD